MFDPRTLYPDGACRACNGQGSFRNNMDARSSVPSTCAVCNGTGGTVPGKVNADTKPGRIETVYGIRYMVSETQYLRI